MSNVLDMDATTIAQKIKSREITSSLAVQTYISHLKRLNPTVACLVEDRFAAASEEAKMNDRLVERGEVQGKLSGVPISVKEAFDVAGMQTTGGLSHRQGQLAETDAAVVARLKAEGAIILGKTNTPALCFCQESENKLYGRTNNPWDLERTAGGSSGGEGALIAVGGAAAGVGSDIGGSIRFPAHFNGVIGFKSGNRQIPQQGNFPHVDHPLQERMLGMGPMTKSVRDAEFIYALMTDAKPDKKNLSEFTIDILPKQPGIPLSNRTEKLLRHIKETLGKQFATDEKRPPFFYDAALMWQEIMSIDGAHHIAAHAFGERKIRPVREYVKEVTTGKAELHRYLTWALIGAKMFRPSQKRVQQIGEILERGDEELSRYLDKRVLIFPVYHRAALPHGKLYREIFSIRKTFRQFMPYVAYANVWGLPALTVPVGMDAHGMPISVQLISRIGNEDALFQLGKVVEKRFRGYLRCKAWDK